MDELTTKLKADIESARLTLLCAENALRYRQSVCEHVMEFIPNMAYASVTTGVCHPLSRQTCTNCGLHTDTIDRRYVVPKPTDESLIIWGD